MSERVSIRRAVLLAGAVVLIGCCVATMVIAVRSRHIRGASMSPTLTDGDRVLIGSADRIERFDIVIGRFTSGGADFVKRVIAVAGDAVSIDKPGTAPAVVAVQPGASGAWYVVDNPAWRSTENASTSNCCAPDGRSSSIATRRIVPPGEVFVIGDNFAESEDSRRKGWAPRGLLEGVVEWRVLPLSRVGRVDGSVTLVPPR